MSIGTIARRMGRTKHAIVHMARRLQLGSPRRGTVTVVTLAERTGYHRTQIQNAAAALGIRVGNAETTTLRRPTGRRWSAIDDEDADRIIEWLASRPDGSRIRKEHKGAWGEMGRGGVQKPTECVVCQMTRFAHYAKGMCVGCYDKRRKSAKAS